MRKSEALKQKQNEKKDKLEAEKRAFFEKKAAEKAIKE
jgi:hypothetical protein